MTTTDSRLPCRANPDLFFAPDGQHTGSPLYTARVDQARALCRHCPERVPCRDRGRALGATGVWGGEDDVDRTEAGSRIRSQRVRIAA
ncbi:WhiB family transcriptional regulator [Kitasatospora sp. NPDC057692]|uniref:WhiB family transcriptional regulator n=1 Tax=Kitasatospora sp. NPDC057692 TaxID=3346215 RepID=UPI0036B21A5F